MDDLISRQDVINAVLVSNFSACTVYGRSEEGMATAKELIQAIKNLPSAQPKIIRCKHCKHFELDHFDNVNGIQLITAHEICTRWGDGCKTDINGFCFLAEQEGEER